MQVVELAGDTTVLATLLKQRDKAFARPPGLHLSDIVTDLVKRAGPKYGRITDPDEDEDPATRELYWFLGQQWELGVKDALTAAGIAGVTPAPRQFNGVWMTPDWQRTRTGAIDEMKYTTVSMHGALDNPKLLKYLWQLLAYMLAWEAKVGRLHVCFAAGNYREIRRPVYRVFTLRPTRRELETNWRMLKQHAEDYRLGDV